MSKTYRMEQYPKGHNWATEPGDADKIALLTVLTNTDPNCPEDHYIGDDRHRVVRCVRCNHKACFDCGQIYWSAPCDQAPARQQ